MAHSPDPTYRFRHAVIQEATYGGLLRAERRRLHRRAALALEAGSEGRLEDVAAVLGRHFAAAGEVERAVHHLQVAGECASAVFANEEAISSFRSAWPSSTGSALGPTEAMPRSPSKPSWPRCSGGPDALQRPVRHIMTLSPRPPLTASGVLRIQTSLGRLEDYDNRTEPALAAFDAAEQLLSERPEGRDEAGTDVWLELMLFGRALVHLHRYELELARADLSQARPVMEATGSPAWRCAYYHFLAIQRAIEHRYRVDEDDLNIGRTAVLAAVEVGDEAEIAHDTNYLGLLLLCHGDLAAAREQLELSLAIADRMGYLGLRRL